MSGLFEDLQSRACQCSFSTECPQQHLKADPSTVNMESQMAEWFSWMLWLIWGSSLLGEQLNASTGLGPVAN